nr:MAG TPA: lysozyme [Caudoviricetes sp.]
MLSLNEVQLELNKTNDTALREELLSNAAAILTTLRGTNPQDRAMGLVSSDILGQNANRARCAYSIQAIEQIEKYEPRLSVTEISFEVADSRLIPKVVMSYVG